MLSYFECKTLFSIFLLFVLLLVFLCSFQGAVQRRNDLLRDGGDKGSRTPDLLLARQALSHLSYTPKGEKSWQPPALPYRLQHSTIGRLRLYRRVRNGNGCFPQAHRHQEMGLSGLEPPTSRLSGVRSNRLSYKPTKFRQPPALPYRLQHSTIGRLGLNHRVRDENGCVP